MMRIVTKIFKSCFMRKKVAITFGIMFLLLIVGGWFVLVNNSSVPYKGGCSDVDYINGDCIFDEYKIHHKTYYPLVGENDDIWLHFRNYDNKKLLDIAQQELEKTKDHQKYKFQEEQIARIQSFIDILSKKQ